MIEKQVDLILLGWSMGELGSATVSSLLQVGVFRRRFSGRVHPPTFSFLVMCFCARLCFSARCADQVVHVFAWQRESVKWRSLKKEKASPKKEDGNKRTPWELIMHPIPCCFFCADFKHGEAGALSGAQRVSDLAGVLEAKWYKQEGKREEPRSRRQRACGYFRGQETLPDPISWNLYVLLRGSQPFLEVTFCTFAVEIPILTS